MIRRLALAATVAAIATGVFAASAPESPPPPFRIAVQAKETGACAPGAEAVEAGARAYFQHLEHRLERPVLRCPMATPAAAAAALDAGDVDMAALDPDSFARTGGKVRALFTARAPGGLTRVPVMLATLQSAPLSASVQGTVVFTGPGPSALDNPRAVLAEQGYRTVREVIAANEDDGLARLRAGQGDAVALHVGAWQRKCRGDTPAEDKCKDLRVAWVARKSAPAAFVVRRDMEDPFRFRLLGVHIAMHLENPEAFAWASAQLAPGAENLEPAEAQALTTARLQ